MKYKTHLLLACLVTLLPVPFALLLEAPGGIAGYFKSMASLPVGLVLTLVLCAWLTSRDPGNKGRNRKPMAMVLWMIPLVSNLCCGIAIALGMGYEFPVTAVFMAAMGLMFAAIGNYLPKCKMNYTMGIKVCWAYTSEENWNATHRFGGRVWFIGGLIMTLAGLLPVAVSVPVMMIVFLVMTVVPMVYSWRYYKMQKARGDELKPFPQISAKPKSVVLSILLPAVILLGVGVMLVTGNLAYTFQEDYLYVEADYYGDFTLRYESIDAVELREENVSGTRVGGYGSFRLLMGFFQNEEFGTYTRYTYYKPEACVVITAGTNTIVLSAETPEQTHQLYQDILERIQ